MYNAIPIQSTCATIAALLGITPPANTEAPCTIVTDYVASTIGKPDSDTSALAERVVMYNPDAVAMWLWQKYPQLYTPMTYGGGITIPICTVMPSVTPVCFASMYTGLTPEHHGIRKYEKPVLTCGTIFDACIKAGKKCAIVSTAGDSMSKIFLEREMDYYIYPTVDEVNEKAHQLIAESAYDLLCIYNANFDSTMHRHGPEAPESIAALVHNCNEYAAIRELIRQTGKKTVLAFAPDHGCHEIDGGLGSHGLDMEEDLNILHFWQCIG